MKMKALVCANCGSSLEVKKDNDGVIVCAYCGRETTLPKYTIAPQVAITLQMAETELSACAFQKAYDLYAKAAEQDANEPEAYFGMALAECRVQYIKDSVADRLQPICHEIGNRKFSDDANYKKALSLASPKQRAVYKKRAEEIDYIRSQFFKISSSGVKYDCFICVKVTNEDKEHTEDCFIAQKLYRALKEEGYRPFYSEEEIGSRRGMDYEAMILYALCTSACMLVVCLDKNYLLTKWVKNEYTRFLSMSKEKGKKAGNLAFVYQKEPIDSLPAIDQKFRSICYDNAYAFDEIEGYVSEFCGKRGKKYRRKRAKIITACALSALVLAGAGTGIALALGGNDEPKDYSYQLNAQNDGYVLTEWKKAGSLAEIPAVIENLPVVEIGAEAFKNKTALTDIVIPDSVTKIGTNAFGGCTSLKSLTLSSAVETLGESVLDGCTSLKSLTVQTDAVQNLAELFGQTPAWLTSLDFQASEIDENYAKNCTSLVSIRFSAELEQIGSYAFYGCGALQSVKITSELQTIGDYAFYNCGNLVSVNLPFSVTEIGEYAFAKASKLLTCSVPNNLKKVGANAFEDCIELGNFLLPNGVQSVGNNAFKNCKKMTQFILPASVETLGSSIIAGCEKLTSVSVSLDHAPTFGYFFGSETNLSSVFPSNLKTVTVLGAVIPQNAFISCAKLTKVVVSESVESIGANAFSNCTSLTQVLFEDQDNLWQTSGDIQIEKPQENNYVTLLTQTHVNVAWTKIKQTAE
ncbi:MAG: leucine-rich repeat protein [Clostridia bacterium]|nr:leucine-rich repeat protein [Clostridia bacterium]